MIDKRTSFTAADSFPVKMLLDVEFIEGVRYTKKIKPIHIQILPTNKCNMNCSFCSCSERNKNQELDFELTKKIIDKCKSLGTKAVTVTGGGEPLLYSHFDDLIDYFDLKEIKVGLVSNGLVLHKANFEALNKITWCRISNGDERHFSDKYKSNLETVVKNCPDVDWAFSHVVSDKPNLEEITRIINFANEHNFTHVRLVADLFHPGDINMDEIHKYLKDNNIDCSRVIFQNRKEYTPGSDCYIGFLKPLIGADGKVYLCCGVQYALKTPSKDLPEELCLGDAIDIDKIYDRSNVPANGNICIKCYYSNYNMLLKSLMNNLEHIEFV